MSEQSIFTEALEMADAAARAAFLDQACADDQELRQRVEKLLERHAQAGSFLESPKPGTTAEEPQVAEKPGKVIGPYKLLEQIGEGGFGVVFMAEQQEPIRRRVALKVIKPGMDGRQVIARFEAERQALALMDHPNIARVMDAGETSSGRPFFVMELVKGLPITVFCDQAKLPPRDRLELFASVCQAVQHAHQKGIIHRDIKPSNVLVTLHDGKPVAKVIDFGIAKATGVQLTEKTLFTNFAAMLGTPLYMSPEQAGLSGLDTDTRSDIYSLGVLLYELLTGSTPFNKDRFQKAAYDEIRRIIREEEPPKPSTRLSDSKDSLASISAQRHMEPAKLTKLVRGELDWIVMKALEKNRNRRYETAKDFAADVQRYLNDEPVQACPPSVGYRLRKLVRRNKGPVLAASLVLLALVAGMVGTTVGLVRANQARQAEAERAEGERLAKEQAQSDRDANERARQKEEQERIYAQAIADFVKNDFLALTSVEGQDRFGGTSEVQLDKDATLRQLLDRAAAKLNQRNDLDPRIEAELRWMIGVNYRGLGEAGLAIPFLERCVTLRKELFGPEDEETLSAQHSLAVALEAAGKLDLALPLYEDTLKLSKAKQGADHPNTLTSMNSLALGYKAAGKLDLALPLLEDTLKLRKAKLGADHSNTLTSMNNLAAGYQDAGKPDLALPLLEDTLKLMKAKLGADHSNTLTSMNNLALSYQDAGKLDLALPLFEDTLKLRKAKLGANHPSTITSMNNLASGYHHAGKLDLALPLYEDTLKLRKAKLGTDHPHTLWSMNNLAAGYRDAGKLDLALPLLEDTLKLRKAKLGADHPDTLTSMNNLALGYQAAGKLDLALPLYEDTLKLRNAKLGADHPHTLASVINLAAGYQAAGKLDLALPLFEEAAAGVEKRHFQHVYAELIVNNLIGCHERLKQYDDAEAWRRKWLAVVKERAGTDSLPYAGELTLLGLNLLQQKKWNDAERLLRECLALREKKEPDAWTTFSTKSMLGGALLDQKKYADAEPLLVKGYQGMNERAAKIPPQGRVRLTEAIERLVRLYEAMEKKDEAAKWRKELEAPGKAAENTVKPKDK